MAVRRLLKDFVAKRRRSIFGQAADGLSPRKNSTLSLGRGIALSSVVNFGLY